MSQKLPTQLKLLRGTYKKSRENPHEPQSNDLLTEHTPPPEQFDRAERKIWREVLRRAIPGVLYASDYITVETIVPLIAKMRRREEFNGVDSSRFLKCLEKLAMNPVDRSRVIAPAKKKPQDDDPVSQFLNDNRS